MTIGKPRIGLVISHMYLWRDEAAQGREEGRKARPCVIIHVRQTGAGKTEVFIAPITHVPPESPDHGKEIPAETKQRLKLDHERSWILTSEVNRFTWTGPDIRKTRSGEYFYGHLPPGLTKAVISQIQTNARKKRIDTVDRD